MPNAYKLLVGLSAVNSAADYYGRNLPGFDGRRGCEGAAIDLQLMDRLTHYIGLEPVTAEPLRNAGATAEAVLAHLTQLTPVLRTGDLVFIYFSCHGQCLGEGPTRGRSSIGNTVNALLLWNRPLLNLEVLRCLSGMPGGARIFTMFDCCHAGLGSNLEIPFGELLAETSKNLAPNHSFPNSSGLRITESATRQELADRLAPELLANIRASFQPQAVHFGASRDETKAMGGAAGSRFTRLFYQVMAAGGSELSYWDWRRVFEETLSPDFPAVVEWMGKGTEETTARNDQPPPRHWAHQKIFTF